MPSSIARSEKKKFLSSDLLCVSFENRSFRLIMNPEGRVNPSAKFSAFSIVVRAGAKIIWQHGSSAVSEENAGVVKARCCCDKRD